MNKILFLGIAMTAFTMLASAQHARRYDVQKAAARQTEQMKKVLDLNDAQYVSVKQINDKYAEKAKALRDEASEERRDVRDKFLALRQERQDEINAVLTSDQREKWIQYKNEKKERRDEVRQSRDEQQKEMKEVLNLSDEQSQKMDDEREAFMAKARAVRENSSLTAEKKKADLKALRVQHEAAIEGILSAEQFAKWQAMKQQRKALHKEHQFRKGK